MWRFNSRLRFRISSHDLNFFEIPIRFIETVNSQVQNIRARPLWSLFRTNVMLKLSITNCVYQSIEWTHTPKKLQPISFFSTELPPHFLPWSEWSNCTRNCGGGITSRTRNCSKEGQCSHLGELEQREHCNVYKCNSKSNATEKWSDVIQRNICDMVQYWL